MSKSSSNEPSFVLGPFAISFLTLAISGWLIWIGNLMSIPFFFDGFIPEVNDLSSLLLSSLLFVIIGLTPSLIKSIFRKQ